VISCICEKCPDIRPIAGIAYEDAVAIHYRHVDDLMKIPGVVGAGLGVDGIHVETSNPKLVPQQIEGLPVIVDPPVKRIPTVHTGNNPVHAIQEFLKLGIELRREAELSDRGDQCNWSKYKAMTRSSALDVECYAPPQCTMRKSFKDKDTEVLYQRKVVKRFSGIARQAVKRLRILDSAETIQALSALPSNRLEALKGDRQGQYSIRINEQWRVCFV
jgi:toxin HigB-1